MGEKVRAIVVRLPQTPLDSQPVLHCVAPPPNDPRSGV